MTKEELELILKYMSDKYFREGTIEQLKKHPHYKLVGWWHDSLAFYRMGNFRMSEAEVRDIPNPYYGYTAYVRKKGRSEQWIYMMNGYLLGE